MPAAAVSAAVPHVSRPRVRSAANPTARVSRAPSRRRSTRRRGVVPRLEFAGIRPSPSVWSLIPRNLEIPRRRAAGPVVLAREMLEQLLRGKSSPNSTRRAERIVSL